MSATKDDGKMGDDDAEAGSACTAAATGPAGECRLSASERKLLYAVLAISLLSLLVSLYVLYLLTTGQAASAPLAPPANF